MRTRSEKGSDDARGGARDMAPEAWLRARVPAGGLGSSAKTLLNYLLTNIGEAVYARAAEVARVAGVSVSSVTRLAQQLGFDGWPDLQRSLRARYLSGLSMVDVSEVHGVTDTPFQSAMRRDISSLTQAVRDLDEHAIRRIAELLTNASQIHVAAMGSFAAVGQALSHNLLLAGYPSYGLLDRDPLLANTVARLGPSDVLVVCSYWRHYRVVVGAAIAARRRGAKVVVISDYLPQALAPVAEEVVLIPAEGTSFFASLTVPIAVQQGIMATLARIDPERTRRQLEVSEELWGELDLLVDPLRG
ncbi:MurR/RpiR family transcriptional regulator [Leucobacter sp. wl10]|uniref:MurR/RpiR family transcriptional regulator n=1 Tax=Leucobacter sp. wl10 TaxID=2304677 RepID=UPI0013C33396|nr:MurR/RpiR family transcriptional regulator [Leucobacter sp. wl10]